MPVAIVLLETLANESPNVGILYVLLFLAWSFVFTAIAIIVHELAHWSVTRLLGGICPIVAFGEGVPLFSLRSRNTLWQFCPSPTHGSAYCAYPPDKQDILRYVLTLLAGGIANLVIALASFYVAYEVVEKESGAFYWYTNSFINGLFFVFSFFVPSKRKGAKTDGQLILGIIRDKKKFMESFSRTHQHVVAQALVMREKMDDLYEYISSCEDYESSVLLCHFLGYSFFYRFDINAFIYWSERSLSLMNEGKDASFPRNDSGEYIKAMVQNNIAFGLYCLDATDIQRMKALAEEAFDKAPWEPAIIGTYAAVKIRTGEISEGISLLERQIANKPKFTKRSLAMSYFCLAEGYKIANRLREMEIALDKVRNLDASVLDHMPILVNKTTCR